MRKLQELFPNLDKVVVYTNDLDKNIKDFLRKLKSSSFCFFQWQQTNTADMLDSAVEYIKDLQKQVKVL